MAALIDLATYNKALSDKQKLSATLKKLQQASSHGILTLSLSITDCFVALLEFNTLKQQHMDSINENDILRESVYFNFSAIKNPHLHRLLH